MVKTILKLLLVCIFVCNLTMGIFPCTTFTISKNQEVVYGRNLDFMTGKGYVIINKRNILKTASIAPPEKPLAWVSKYGSVTFNQIGRCFPYGGMNERGLVIEQMMLPETIYPEVDSRYGLIELQWIQYQLDNFATVKEVIASDGSVRISKQAQTPLHFLVSDQKGNSATIEFIEGKTVIHDGKNLPFPVLANSTYDDSLNYCRNLFSHHSIIPETANSLDRFARAAYLLTQFHHCPASSNTIDYAFGILHSVSSEYTQWSIVYDLKNLMIYFKTKNNPNKRNLSLKDFDFSCNSPVYYIDIDSENIDFQECNSYANELLIRFAFENIDFLKPIPDEMKMQMIARLVNYPETTVPVGK